MLESYKSLFCNFSVAEYYVEFLAFTDETATIGSVKKVQIKYEKLT